MLHTIIDNIYIPTVTSKFVKNSVNFLVDVHRRGKGVSHHFKLIYHQSLVEGVLFVESTEARGY